MRLVNENIKGVAESDDGLAWIYTLLRFNVMKLVGISRRSNYQSKDLAHTQKTGEWEAAHLDLVLAAHKCTFGFVFFGLAPGPMLSV